MFCQRCEEALTQSEAGRGCRGQGHRRRDNSCVPPPQRVTIHEPRASVGSQSPQPHLEDGTTYHPRRPTRLDKIKNFHAEDQVAGIGAREVSVASLGALTTPITGFKTVSVAVPRTDGASRAVPGHVHHLELDSDSNEKISAVLTPMATAMARMFFSDGFRRPLSIPER